MMKYSTPSKTVFMKKFLNIGENVHDKILSEKAGIKTIYYDFNYIKTTYIYIYIQSLKSMESKPLNVNIVSEICGYEWFYLFYMFCLYFPSFY